MEPTLPWFALRRRAIWYCPGACGCPIGVAALVTLSAWQHGLAGSAHPALIGHFLSCMERTPASGFDEGAMAVTSVDFYHYGNSGSAVCHNCVPMIASRVRLMGIRRVLLLGSTMA